MRGDKRGKNLESESGKFKVMLLFISAGQIVCLDCVNTTVLAQGRHVDKT